jgi:hypothetical protein
MGTVGHLAEQIKRGLRRLHPGLHKTVTRKLAATVAAVTAVLQTQTANTAARAAVLPIETERADMRLQWIARLLPNPLLDGVRVMEPFAPQRLNEAAASGQTVVLSMDQTDIGDPFAILMVSVRFGERAMPLAWAAEARRILDRLEIHNTPKHGSGLDVAEIELSVFSEQCLAGRRIDAIDTLRREARAWAVARNAAQVGVDWQFTNDKARIKLKHLHPQVILT